MKLFAGQVDGKVGVFPDNFVELLPEEVKLIATYLIYLQLSSLTLAKTEKASSAEYPRDTWTQKAAQRTNDSPRET